MENFQTTDNILKIENNSLYGTLNCTDNTGNILVSSAAGDYGWITCTDNLSSINCLQFTGTSTCTNNYSLNIARSDSSLFTVSNIDGTNTVEVKNDSVKLSSENIELEGRVKFTNLNDSELIERLDHTSTISDALVKMNKIIDVLNEMISGKTLIERYADNLESLTGPISKLSESLNKNPHDTKLGPINDELENLI